MLKIVNALPQKGNTTNVDITLNNLASGQTYITNLCDNFDSYIDGKYYPILKGVELDREGSLDLAKAISQQTYNDVKKVIDDGLVTIKLRDKASAYNTNNTTGSFTQYICNISTGELTKITSPDYSNGIAASVSITPIVAIPKLTLRFICEY